MSWDDFESKYGTAHVDYRNLIAFRPHREIPRRGVSRIHQIGGGGDDDYEYYARQDYSVDGYWQHAPAHDSYPVVGAQAVANYLH